MLDDMQFDDLVELLDAVEQVPTTDDAPPIQVFPPV